MKCQIKWIDSDGKPTPDENDAVAMAHHHESIWSCPTGSPDNYIVGYSDKITGSYPICAQHLAQMRPEWRGWSVSNLAETESAYGDPSEVQA